MMVVAPWHLGGCFFPFKSSFFFVLLCHCNPQHSIVYFYFFPQQHFDGRFLLYLLPLLSHICHPFRRDMAKENPYNFNSIEQLTLQERQYLAGKFKK
jgi:hypothetical protein